MADRSFIGKPPYRCSLCGQLGAKQAHGELGIICQECYEKQAPICDFCSTSNPSWEYGCETFVTKDMGGYRFVEEWLACDVCHEFIEDDDYNSLLKFSMAEYKRRKSPVVPMQHDRIERLLYEKVGEIHQLFKKNRKGDCKPITNTKEEK